MSASNKKKLRAEQGAAKLTEKQLQAQKEEKKTRLYTIMFVVVLVLLIAAAIFAGVTKKIASSGVRERTTIAATVGSHEISNAELNYFYVDAINNFYSQNGAYAAMYGLDAGQPLNKQVIDPETGYTWADNFIDTAIGNAATVYALVDEANAKGFTLPAADQEQVDSLSYTISAYATLGGYTDGDAYMKAYYGNGASVEGFQEYSRINLLAQAYREHYENSLTYTDAQIRAKEQENYNLYSSYTYNQYYLASSKYLTGGVVGEDGVATYTDAQRAEAARAAEADAKTLVADSITSVEAMDKAIAALPVNADTESKSTAYTNTQYNAVNSKVIDWVSDSARKAGDKTVIANIGTNTSEDGTETEVVNGYYVVYFISSTDNKVPTVNVRHILAAFESETDGEAQTFTDAEKAAAKAKAESVLETWKSGAATEESFAELAAIESDDPGSRDNGGLYEDVYPGQMVPAFNDWCFDSARKPGDTAIVETDYGYHVMYFVGTSATTYRDTLIIRDLRSADFTAWYDNLVTSMPQTPGDTRYIRKDLVLNNGNN